VNNETHGKPEAAGGLEALFPYDDIAKIAHERTGILSDCVSCFVLPQGGQRTANKELVVMRCYNELINDNTKPLWASR